MTAATDRSVATFVATIVEALAAYMPESLVVVPSVHGTVLERAWFAVTVAAKLTGAPGAAIHRIATIPAVSQNPSLADAVAITVDARCEPSATPSAACTANVFAKSAGMRTAVATSDRIAAVATAGATLGATADVAADVAADVESKSTARPRQPLELPQRSLN